MPARNAPEKTTRSDRVNNRLILVHPPALDAPYASRSDANYDVESVKRKQPRLDGFDVIVLNWDVANGDFAFGADKTLSYFETFIVMDTRLATDRALGRPSLNQAHRRQSSRRMITVDPGKADNLTTSTLRDDAYAFIFDPRGPMAGVSIEGTKITKVD